MPPKAKIAKSSHLETPQKAKARGTIEYLEAKGIEYTQKEVATHFGLTRKQIRNALQSGSDRRHENDPSTLEQRGGYNKALSKKDLDLYEDLIENNSFKGHALTWNKLAENASLKCSVPTIRSAIKERGYNSCIAYSKPYLDDDLLKLRKR